ncbi:MAG: CoA transferase [Chloroflexota bacterium]|nr:CoA transferase [Chloroflexota bacterium]
MRTISSTSASAWASPGAKCARRRTWLDDEHARARGFFVEVEHPELGRTITYPGAPYRFSETPWRIERRAPLLGEHTEEVLAELGASAPSSEAS